MKKASKITLFLAALVLALFFACQKQELPTAFSCEGSQPAALADRSADTIPSDTLECVDSVRFFYALLGMDTCSSDSLPVPADSLCCLFRFKASASPAGVSGVSYFWTLQELPGGVVQSIGTGEFVDFTLPSHAGFFRICVTVKKPGCPTKKICRVFRFNPKDCSIKWLE